MSHAGLLNSIVTTCIFRRQNGQRSVGGRGSTPDPAGGASSAPETSSWTRGSGRDGKRRKRRREGKSRMWPPLPLHPPLLALASRSASGSDGTVESTGPDFIVPIYRGVICFVATVHGWPRLLGRTDGALRSSAKSLHFPDHDPIASS